MKNLVLFSGGMDSTTALSIAAQEGETWALSVRYGSNHEDAEMSAAAKVCELLKVPRMSISLPTMIFEGGKSALLGETEVPNEEYHDPEKESPSATVVPFRNATLLSVATAYAEAHGFDRVWVAVHMSDAEGFAYPDCTPEFMGSMAAAIYVGTHRKVRLMVPFQWVTKAGIVQIAAVVGAPLEETWSCYRGGNVHCGRCPTCIERYKAFVEAGFKDPVPYAFDSILNNVPDGLRTWEKYYAQHIS